MKKGRVLNLSQLKFTTYLLENKVLLIALFVFLIGIIFGITAVRKNNLFSNFTTEFLESYILLRESSGFFKVFFNSFFTYIIILLLFFIFGTSMFGVVTAPIILWFCGMLFGSITSHLYSEYALKGIAFNAVIFIPSTIIFAVLLLFACKESVNFSLKISSITFSNNSSFNLSNLFKKFIIMFLIFVGVCIVSAALDTVLSLSFIKYFDF